MLKDFKTAQAISLSKDSFKKAIGEAALEQGFHVENISISENDENICKPAQLVLTKYIDQVTKSEVVKGLDQIKFVDLDMNFTDLSTSGNIVLYLISD